MPASDDSKEVVDPDVNAKRIVIDDDEVRIPLQLLRNKDNALNDDSNFMNQFSTFWQQFLTNLNLAETAPATTAPASS